MQVGDGARRTDQTHREPAPYADAGPRSDDITLLLGALSRGDREGTALGPLAAPAGPEPLDLIALDRALDALVAAYPRKARVVELLFFGGLTAAEAAEVLEVTGRTVERDWSFARAWLLWKLAGQGGDA
ncbi:MAG: ECF-type sigma factor [Candidatus Eiseniibacteriota bacterium]|jgi:DNA-directed RNA polymerase specialized sigma24 family protein